ncbi:hypothetical protein DITRI_Ditri08aG0023200 [Diplodiscus trichospermus]
MEEEGYNQLIEDQWGKLQVSMVGPNNIWGKFRVLKGAIKEWCKVRGNNEPIRTAELEKEIQELEEMVRQGIGRVQGIRS